MTKQVFGVQEWAETSCDVSKGCPHDCHYCYAKAAAAKYARRDPADWHTQVLYWTKLQKVEKMKPCKVMFPAHHDIHWSIIGECLEAIERLIHAGHRLLLVTKPHYECVAEICKRFQKDRGRILFRFTIGSTDDAVLKLWEPNAPDFSERCQSLRLAYREGYRTSISAEPMLDTNPGEIVRVLGRYVNDAIWFGKPNFLIQRLTMNNAPQEVRQAGFKLLGEMTDSYIRDLYDTWKYHEGVKWKESIKKVVGLEVATKAGTDE